MVSGCFCTSSAFGRKFLYKVGKLNSSLLFIISLQTTKLNEMNATQELDKLKKNNKDDLCGYIQIVRKNVEELESYKIIENRVQQLERSHMKSLQYQRRDSIEIHGLSGSINDGDLEGVY